MSNAFQEQIEELARFVAQVRVACGVNHALLFRHLNFSALAEVGRREEAAPVAEALAKCLAALEGDSVAPARLELGVEFHKSGDLSGVWHATVFTKLRVWHTFPHAAREDWDPVGALTKLLADITPANLAAWSSLRETRSELVGSNQVKVTAGYADGTESSSVQRLRG